MAGLQPGGGGLLAGVGAASGRPRLGIPEVLVTWPWGSNPGSSETIPDPVPSSRKPS